MISGAIDKMLIPEAATLVAEYYDEKGSFAGASFETVGVNAPDVFGTDDLLALTFLDVAVKPQGVRALLGPEATALSDGLARLPTAAPLWEADDQVLAAATEVWDRLKEIPSVGPVKAGKLLARKRPALIPVVDKWVISALQAPSNTYWRSIREALKDEDLRARIEACRGTAPATVTTLRLLDVIIWMQFSESDNARSARARVGLPVEPRRSA